MLDRRFVWMIGVSLVALLVASLPAAADDLGSQRERGSAVTFESENTGSRANEAITTDRLRSGFKSKKNDSPKNSERGMGDRPPGGADYNYDDISYGECHENPASKIPDGWAKNPFAWCRIAHVRLELTRNGGVTGTAEFDVTNIGMAYQGDRLFHLDRYVKNFKAAGSAVGADYRFDGTTLTLAGKNPSSGPDYHATELTAAEMSTDPLISHTYEAEESEGDPDLPELNWWGNFYPQYVAQDGKSFGFTKEPKVEIRFDSGKYLTYKKGSVFMQYMPYLEYNINDPQVTETAKHILKAQTTPEDTYPKAAGKDIPGATAANPLSRLYFDEERRKENRDAAVAVCDENWPGYPGEDKDCDEYPFSVTYEGGAYGNLDFSAQPVPSLDNEAAGARLGVFLGEFRIQDEDDFFVHIETRCGEFC